ncbi:AraC family transcriptional regulator [Paenibacillus sp. MDMC362]|uniref:AraC family transcriptional regulator n=1 Tax=Paenibacillus sp. MDMC362 TaxID=2977365 RepID=UPI000DC44878|nr:AraC family transcriptional regulator [Paenibacillus sp. MDMC362]RAR43685.1 AraC family transcriptional regulator [Paenibacillus sp. MDMC362]
MPDIIFLRDPDLPFLEIKECDTIDNLSYKKHFHEEISIGLIEKGATRVWSAGKQFGAAQGQMVYFPPLLPHACHPENPANWKYTMIFIHPRWLGQTPSDYNSNYHQLHVPILDPKYQNERSLHLFHSCRTLLQQNATPLEVESVLMALMRETGLLQEETAMGYGDSNHKSPAILRVKQYLDCHYKDRITLDTLQDISGISKFHLIRLFAESYHLAPHAYQNLLRINYAKEQLLLGKAIVDVAAETGFYDQSHFTRAFAGCVGTTPLRYAKAATS